MLCYWLKIIFLFCFFVQQQYRVSCFDGDADELYLFADQPFGGLDTRCGRLRAQRRVHAHQLDALHSTVCTFLAGIP